MSRFLHDKCIGESVVWYCERIKYAKLPRFQISNYCMTVIKLLVVLGLTWSMIHIQGQEIQSYMDGITVKISEQYKPPPRISLPITYAQRLSQNKHLEDNMPSYNFDVERRVKEQLEALKRIRNEAAVNRKLRSERIKKEINEREERRKEVAVKEKEVNGDVVSSSNIVEGSSSNYVSKESSTDSNSNGILQPIQVKSCSILTPIPLNNSQWQANNKPADRSPFNISDFEADTSSPFDNLELKTLNDMEELAQVLRSEIPVTTGTIPAYPTYSSVQTLPSHSYSAVNYSSYLNTADRSRTTHQTNTYIPNYTRTAIYNGTSDYYSRLENTPTSYSYGNQSSSVGNTNTLQSYPTINNSITKTAPDLVKALESKLNKQHINDKESSHSNLENLKSAVPTKVEDLDDPFPSLSKNLQDIATAISTMGFPLPRVARACQLFGDDHKKVIYSCK